MRRVLINKEYGGFGLSDVALGLYKAYAGINDDQFHDWEISRDDPILLQVIDQLGIDECRGNLSSLKVVEIPDDVDWEINEYDGKEWVAERHRKWS